MENRVDGLVRRHARVSPGRTAIIDGDLVLTYGQLVELCDEWAARLRSAGIRPGDLVALDCGRGAPSIVAMLAVMSAGAVFAPLDEGDPPSRREAILSDCRPAAILTPSRARPLAASFDLVTCAEHRPSPSIEESAASRGAYVMFTSGSTDKPKGVLVGHGSIINLIREPRFGLGSGVRVAHCGNEAFDGSVLEIWGALGNGGTLISLDTNALLDPASLRSMLSAYQIDVMFLTTAVFNFLADVDPSVFASLKRVVFGGERASASHITAVLNSTSAGRPHLLNGYGPTEATVCAVLADLERDRPHSSDVPIGTPVHNVGCYLLDADGNPAVEGELYLTGSCLAHGYWNNPRATREKFVQIEVHGETSRAYRTGDICRVNDGQLYFVGRHDSMVKLRGHRIELGEVERVLSLEADIREACVLMIEFTEGPEIVAVVSAAAEVSLERIRKSAREWLPRYMLPTRMMVIDSMPLGSTGKIDRERLAARVRANRDALAVIQSEIA